jgi:hypothetical protein
MRNQKWKHHNAYKHGAFSRYAIVPGEDKEEFETLYSALVQEWMPVGATEEDAVLSLAEAIWRKRRAQRSTHFQSATDEPTQRVAGRRTNASKNPSSRAAGHRDQFKFFTIAEVVERLQLATCTVPGRAGCGAAAPQCVVSL